MLIGARDKAELWAEITTDMAGLTPSLGKIETLPGAFAKNYYLQPPKADLGRSSHTQSSGPRSPRHYQRIEKAMQKQPGKKKEVVFE
jgi:hypothetical protein